MSRKRILLLSSIAVFATIAIAGGYYLCGRFPAADAPYSILCIGDSLTESKYGSYIPVLKAQFQSAGIPVKILSAARPGNTSGEYLSFLKRSPVLDETHPDIVIVMLGTNDVRTDSDRTPSTRFTANMKELIDIVKSHHNPDGSSPQVYIATIPPIFTIDIQVFDEQSKNRIAGEIVPAIRQLAGTEHLNLIDVYDYFLNKPAVLPGIHFNERGYELLGKYLFKQISTVLNGIPPEKDERLPRDLSGKIAFQSDRSGNEDIFILDRGGVRQITHSPAFDGYPSLSPDGTRIAFESNRSGRFEIYLADLSGGEELLISSNEDNKSPIWNSTGDRLYFSRGSGNRMNIYKYSLQTKTVEQVTQFPGVNALPTISADERHLVVTGKDMFGWNLYHINLQGMDKNIFAEGYKGCRAKFSHIGERVVFVSHKFDGKGDIFLADILHPGVPPERLTLDSQSYDYYPAFSPDNRYIVFASGPRLKSGNWDIKIMELATRHIWTVTSSPAADRFPSWARG